MINPKPLLLLCLFIASCFSNPASSVSQSTISLEIGADNNDGKTYYLFGRHKFDNGFQIKLGAGESKTTDSLNEEVTSTSNNIGIQSDATRLFSIGLEKSHSLQADTLEIDSTIATLALNTDNWNIFISPSKRDVSLETTRFQRTFSFESNGLSAGITYYGWDPVYLSLSNVSYDYPARISAVSNRINLFTYIFGSTTVDQVFALEDWRSTLEIGYFLRDANIALSHSKGSSALDGSIAAINKIHFGYIVTNNWTLTTTVGVSKIDTSNTSTRFANLNLSYKW